jgi:hypothetical protein
MPVSWVLVYSVSKVHTLKHTSCPYVPCLQLGDAAASEALLDSALSVAKQGAAKGDPAASAALASCLESLVNLRLKLGKLSEAVDTYTQLQAVPGSKSAASVGVSSITWLPAPVL